MNTAARSASANFNYLISYLPLLNPLRPLRAYLFFCHKVVRWFSPHIFILLALCNAILLPTGLFYQVFFGVTVLCVIVAVSRMVPHAYYFMTMNVAMLKGFFLSFKKEKSGGWAREARGDDDA